MADEDNKLGGGGGWPYGSLPDSLSSLIHRYDSLNLIDACLFAPLLGTFSCYGVTS